MNIQRGALRQLGTGVRLLIFMTVLLGVVYPLAITGIGSVVAPAQAAGSRVTDQQGKVVGSELIGQNFLTANGDPDPLYFQPRPSAAGDGYDSMSSGGSNLGPESTDLVAAIQERRAQVAAFNKVAADQVPTDAVTASASGLDPDISVEYARLQSDRVASQRGLDKGSVAELVTRSIQHTGPWLPGQDRVNVLRLNLELAKLDSGTEGNGA
ncbi:potassium-transporting ATPase subunit KdpC [Galactobacter caseinivorans]|uniref:Potassium-transporting ATPase KdpC subunit n=1 Tax=Galactobacter caseinivorans TaxID=2676123 RepID=A0A496PFA5_9MICC|nr:potassium-transporting ATPase subunit KdpC [Galactobacter caseinivorans]RKW69389.1 potassium-transporting ATPase subunit KdpC [Galactobacter caseinivorans]